MRRSPRKPKPAIFYRRVSTKGQGESGVGMEGQLAAIQVYAEQAGYIEKGHYTDVGTAVGPRHIEKRPGLLAAIEHATRLDAPIIVSGLDRISRDQKDSERLVREHDLEIISASDGGMTNSVILSSRAARAQVEREAISINTREALRRKKAEGVRLGNPTNLDEAQKKGAAANKARRQRKVQEIADALRDIDDSETMTAAEVAAALNERGVKTSRDKPWTLPALRVPLREARQLLASRREADLLSNDKYGDW